MIRTTTALCFLPLPALADVPNVMTDIAPLHSITAQVMGDLGAPAVLLPPGADPHDFALRPSDAARLGDADVVFWVGSGLTPWLEEPLETLATQAIHYAMMEAPGWTPLPIRELEALKVDHAEEHDDHGHDDDDHDHDHDHDHSGHDHDEHKHDEHGHDDHDHGHNHDHDHDHGDEDPHAWLDPAVAGIWAQEIASELGRLDPDNAATYAANADATVAEMASLSQSIAAQLAGVTSKKYVLPHDGYQYFEARFGLTAQAAIAGIDARTPGPAQVASLKAALAEEDISCVFSDAEIGDRWAQLITEGTSANTTQIDGVGVGLNEGPALYGQLLTRLADDFASCLSGQM